MAGDRDEIDHATAEVEVADFVRPVSDSIKVLGRRKFSRNESDRHSRILHGLDLGVTCDVIFVWVGMHDDQRDALAVIPREPVLYRLPQRRSKIAIPRS